MNERQKELARHALGLPNKQKMTYRNHFVAGSGHPDFHDWLEMTSRGEAAMRTGRAMSGGDPIFYVTPLGLTLAVDLREKVGREELESAQIALERWGKLSAVRLT